MPRPPKKKAKTDSTDDSNVLTLTCEWKSCFISFLCIDDLILHVEQHLTNHLEGIECLDVPLPNDIKHCPWSECDYNSERDVHDFKRHLFYHCFHVKIKAIGQKLLESKHLAQCQLDRSSRNAIPELPERLLCGWKYCQIVYDNPEIFYRHVYQHAEVMPEGNKVKGGCPCEWEGCDIVTRNRYKLKDHIKSHTQEKLTACPTCGGLFANNTKFLDHIRRQTPVEKQAYQCSHCNKQFYTERLLRDHMRLHINHYKCPHCEMTCPAPSSLDRHIQYRHRDQKPYTCHICEHSCKSIADLRKHIEKHNENTEYVCHIKECNFTCKAYYALTRHFRQNHGPSTLKYLCHVCSQLYKRSHSLTTHLKKQHNFKWPSGHIRFRYKLHTDGLYRLQTVRYESVELTDELLHVNDPNASDNGPSTDASKSSHEEVSDYNLSLLRDVAVSQTEEHKDGFSTETYRHVLPSGVVSLNDMIYDYDDIEAQNAPSNQLDTEVAPSGGKLVDQSRGEFLQHLAFLSPSKMTVVLSDESVNASINPSNSEEIMIVYNDDVSCPSLILEGDTLKLPVMIENNTSSSTAVLSNESEHADQFITYTLASPKKPIAVSEFRGDTTPGKTFTPL